MVSGRARLSRARRTAFSLPESMMEKAMSALTQSCKGEASTSPGSLIEWLATIAMQFTRAASQRRALGELARLDDRMLKDIGFVRSDIDSAASLPLGRDRVAFLLARRAKRSNACLANRHY
jgi:uncharacterized protein YjiS (DUF1127 family)